MSIETKSTPPGAATDREVLIIRTLDAPRDKVFAAWASIESLEKWYAPHGCTVTFRRLEPRPGGKFLSCIRSPQGHECWCCGEYEEFQPPEKLVCTMSNCDPQGNVVDPVSVGMDPEWPGTTRLSVTFEDDAGRTRITLHQSVSESLAKRTGAHPSWLQMFDRLSVFLTGA